ncbi:Uncharacterized protein PECH_001581 [Penicillium ucsense]|uniref:Mucin n=1 Tax=Penicillium ucsense TaxID=2839758 RepID=A0A8J8WGA1_9EURO|nr:Uncharacterized protein PECM_001068 [Penicillium ucsense]KAF7732652.1 Uncharacterized protein PECH_001581 [Penicillium ucsense]
MIPMTSEEDLRSLPPAVRRKLFSNVERLRIREAQNDGVASIHSTDYRNYSPHMHQHPHLQNHHQYHPRTNGSCLRGESGPFHRDLSPHCPSLDWHSLLSSPSHPRALRNASSTSLPKPRVRRLDKGSKRPRRSAAASRKLRTPDALHLAYLVAQADSQCFHALPTKVQQQLFSPEERRRLRHAHHQSIILDAADEVLYRRPRLLRRQSSSESFPSETTFPVSQVDTVFYDSDSDYESDDSMDPAFYESFRWLNEEADLDLALDEYHAHVADAAAKSKTRRRPSFRRSLSFSTHALKQHRTSPSMPSRGFSTDYHHQPPAPLFSPPNSPLNRSSSRPGSRHLTSFQHAVKPVTTTIDPAAQYYQDPDARLKLRVYLASPQKFDEAIEFGFPSLEQEKESAAPKDDSSDLEFGSGPPSSPTVFGDGTGTFFEDDDGTVVGSPSGSIEEPSISRVPSHVRDTARPSTDTPSLLQCRQSFLSNSTSCPRRLPGNREMTLKMTLTRPDLRTESPTPSTGRASEDPLRLADLPPPDRTRMIWDQDEEDHGVVRKMWRRLRRRV